MTDDLFMNPMWGVVGIPGNIWTPALGPKPATAPVSAPLSAASATGAFVAYEAPGHGEDHALRFLGSMAVLMLVILLFVLVVERRMDK